MDCKTIEDLISRFIENDVSENLHKEISLHIKECDKCRKLKEKIENLISISSELEEDLPFFLKNRLYNISEPKQSTKKEKIGSRYLKWIAALIGAVVLFLNIFYFTNIYPQANRTLHLVVSKIETFAVQTGSFIEKIKSSKDDFIFTFFKKEQNDKEKNKNENIKIKEDKNG